MKRCEKFANALLIAAIVACGALMLYAMFLSKLQPQQLWKYYLICLGGIVFFAFGLLRWHTETKVNVTLFCISVVSTIYFIEIALFFQWIPNSRHRQMEAL